MTNSRIIQVTDDGSHTLFLEALNATYHSKHGAIGESRHVYIKEGLQHFIENELSPVKTIHIFEMGFGSGLNALLSLQFAIIYRQGIKYHTIEPFPLSAEEASQLNYPSLINEDLKSSFYLMHESDWDKDIELHPLFSFQKIKKGAEEFETNQKFHIIYFDAFDPNTQPGLWTEPVFKKIFNMLYPGGILVTYCSKGIVRRAMLAVGFKTEKLKGPPGKREIIRAIKP